MTVIIGLIDNNTILMGGDSAATNGSYLDILDTQKVFQKEEFLFGVAGVLRVAQVLEHCFRIPNRLDHKSDMGYLVSEFVPSFQDELSTYWDINAEHNQNWSVLIGYRSNLYCLEGNFQIIKPKKDYYSIGSGSDCALGSLHSTEKLSLSANDRLNLAFDAASQFYASVSPPFHILM